MTDSSNFDRFFPSPSFSSTAEFANKCGGGTDVRYSAYRSSLLVRYSTSKYRPCNTTRYRQTTLCCRPSNTTKYKFCAFKMHHLINLFKVLLLSFTIIMAGADDSDVNPRRSSRLSTVNAGDGTQQDQGTEAEQYDAIETAA